MIITAFKSVFKRKYNRHVIYAHNFAGFDSIFILKELIKFTEVKPLVKDGKFIDVSIKYKDYNFRIRDSFLLLPSSLRSLAKSFNVTNKSHFPFEFVNNEDISLDYKGPIPDFYL